MKEPVKHNTVITDDDGEGLLGKTLQWLRQRSPATVHRLTWKYSQMGWPVYDGMLAGTTDGVPQNVIDEFYDELDDELELEGSPYCHFVRISEQVIGWFDSDYVPPIAPLGAIISGTLIQTELLEAFFDCLMEHDPCTAWWWAKDVADNYHGIITVVGGVPRWRREASPDADLGLAWSILLDDLTTMLNNYAGANEYFGACEGDRACFGFWSCQCIDDLDDWWDGGWDEEWEPWEPWDSEWDNVTATDYDARCCDDAVLVAQERGDRLLHMLQYPAHVVAELFIATLRGCVMA